MRQVLVPVIVSDSEGHHVNGLSKDDYTILEDGVEQKITAFTVEHAGSPQDPIPQDPIPRRQRPIPPPPQPQRPSRAAPT